MQRTIIVTEHHLGATGRQDRDDDSHIRQRHENAIPRRHSDDAAGGDHRRVDLDAHLHRHFSLVDIHDHAASE
ncbi:MAG TPA: hypothetical protein ENK57_01910 [Polyangiaceae bacterium]|nr:hypothetical protein [Polyangiaceae bacterium]